MKTTTWVKTYLYISVCHCIENFHFNFLVVHAWYTCAKCESGLAHIFITFYIIISLFFFLLLQTAFLKIWNSNFQAIKTHSNFSVLFLVYFQPSVWLCGKCIFLLIYLIVSPFFTSSIWRWCVHFFVLFWYWTTVAVIWVVSRTAS